MPAIIIVHIMKRILAGYKADKFWYTFLDTLFRILRNLKDEKKKSCSGVFMQYRAKWFAVSMKIYPHKIAKLLNPYRQKTK